MAEGINVKFSDAPLALRWRYARMVWVATLGRMLCRAFGLPPMIEYKLQDGCSWNRKV